MGAGDSRFEDMCKRRSQNEDACVHDEAQDKRSVRSIQSERYRDSTRRYSRSLSRSPGPARKYSRSPMPPVHYREKNEVDVNYYDTPYGCDPRFYCKSCQTYMSGPKSWDQHLLGKRHSNNVKNEGQVDWKYYKKEKPISIESNHRKVPSVDDWKYDSKLKATLKETDNLKAPLAGLEYICVIQKHGESIYQCFLCETYLGNCKKLVLHLNGEKHRTAYLKESDKGKISMKRFRLKSKNLEKHSSDHPMAILSKHDVAGKGAKRHKPDQNIKKDIENDDKALQRCRKERLFENLSSKVTTSLFDGSIGDNLDSRKKLDPLLLIKNEIRQAENLNRLFAKTKTSTYISPGCARKKASAAKGCSSPSRHSSSPSETRFSSTEDISSSKDSECFSENDTSTKDGSFPPDYSLILKQMSKFIDALPPREFLKLILFKLQSVQVRKDDTPLLEKVIGETDAISQCLKRELLNSNLKKELNAQTNMHIMESTTNIKQTVPHCSDLVECEVSSTPELQCNPHEDSKPDISTLPSQNSGPSEFIWDHFPTSSQLSELLAPIPGLTLLDNMFSNKPEDMINDKVKDMVGDQPKDIIGDQPKDIIGDQPKDMVGDQPKDIIGNQAKDIIEDQAKDIIDNQPKDIGDQPKDMIGDQPKDIIENQPKNIIEDQPKEVISDKPGDNIDVIQIE